jgi:recombination protein RecR
MNGLPSSLKHIALFLERLPGIGEKTANRLAFYFLRLPEADLKQFSQNVSTLKSKTRFCKNCYNLTEEEQCAICNDSKRDHGVITIVEDVLDLLSFEAGSSYEGVYHVLHGKIDPLNHVSPEDIYVTQLFDRLKRLEEVKEVVLATNPDMEGEATAMFIRNRLQEFKKETGRDFKVSRLGYGMPMGANLEYADYMTLRKAMENRNEY